MIALARKTYRYSAAVQGVRLTLTLPHPAGCIDLMRLMVEAAAITHCMATTRTIQGGGKRLTFRLGRCEFAAGIGVERIRRAARDAYTSDDPTFENFKRLLGG